VPQHVNEAAAQAAKRIITTRMASDGKMIRLEIPHGTFRSRLAHVRRAGSGITGSIAWA
jgi:hypothetical protein